MKKYIIAITILIFSCKSNSAQETDTASNQLINKSTVILKEYLFFNENDTRVYECTFRDKKSIDTVIIKTFKIENEVSFYPWENDKQFFFISTNSFLGGTSILRNDSLFFKAVEKESSLIKLTSPELKLLFPNIIEIGQTYSSVNIYDKKVEYKIISKTDITILDIKYNDCIHIRKTEYWDKNKNVDNIWVAKNVGVVKWERSTGRVEQLKQFIPNNSIIKEKTNSGPIYLNSEGKKIYESEMLESYKVNSDFSTAIYNDNGYLIREDFYGITGEMSIKYIIYKYDNDGLLIQELYHYNANLEKDSQPNKIWLNEYIYDEMGKLIETRYKFNIEDKEWDDSRKHEHLTQQDVSNLRYSKRHLLSR